MGFNRQIMEEERSERVKEIFRLIEEFLTCEDYKGEAKRRRSNIILKVFNPRGRMNWAFNPCDSVTAHAFEEVLDVMRENCKNLTEDQIRKMLDDQKLDSKLTNALNDIMDEQDVLEQTEKRHGAKEDESLNQERMTDLWAHGVGPSSYEGKTVETEKPEPRQRTEPMGGVRSDEKGRF